MGGKGSGRPTKIRIEGKTIKELAAETGVDPQTLRARARAGYRGHALKRPLEYVEIEGKTLREIAAMTGLSFNTLKWRYYRYEPKTIKEITEPKYAIRVKPKV